MPRSSTRSCNSATSTAATPRSTPSGAAAKRLEGVQDVFTLAGFDHQFSYNNEIAQHTVLYAVGKLVQQITIKEDGTACV